MSLRALHSAASGMEAFAFNLDNIANNLANAGTTGFKRSRVDFEDVYYQYLRPPGAISQTDGVISPTGIDIGLGTSIAATSVDHSQGNLLDTGEQLNVAIVGDGFFQVTEGSEILYTRAGNFSTNADGELVLSSADKGRRIEPAISIPPDATEVTIAPDGSVYALTPGSTTAAQVGNITVTLFINPKGLLQRGDNLYQQTDASGTPTEATPGEQGAGQLKQGFLESSNVEPVRELVDLIKTQRNFELNSNVVSAADQSLQLIGNLRRF